MSVDPEFWLEILDQAAEVRYEGWGEDTPQMSRLHGSWMRRVMGHNDSRPAMLCRKLAADERQVEPCSAAACHGMNWL